MKIKFISICILLLLSGCSHFEQQPTVLLPSDRIFTLPKGKPVELILDKKPITMTFSKNMKVVAPSLLVKQEELLNEETLKKIKAKKSRGKWIKILGSILTILSGAIAFLVKNRKKKK